MKQIFDKSVTIVVILVFVNYCSAGFPFSIPFLDDAEWITDLFGVGPRAPAQLSPCECINPWIGYNGSELYDPFELCGPEGLYPVCYVNCNADCGDVAPAQNPIRCQSKKACEEFKANSTREGRSEPVPERPDPEQTTSNPITNRPFTEATTTKSIVFPETTTTPIKRINPDEDETKEDPPQCRLLSNCSLQRVKDICPNKCKDQDSERLRILSFR